METVLISIGAMVPMLLVLVVVHELGHYFTARSLGVKVLEFGVGFPPRAFGFYTGKTRVAISPHTRFVNMDGVAGLRQGRFVKVTSSEDSEGNLVARVIEAPLASSGLIRGLQGLAGGGEKEEEDGPASPAVSDDWLKHEGKVREVGDGSFLLSDMLYSMNWTPLGGFVRLAGESNPAVPGSLAGRGVGTRFLVLVAGPLMNAILPIVFFTILLMLPQEVIVGQLSVKEIVSGSPAQAAGMQPGDIVLSAGVDEFDNVSSLVRTINLNGGSPIELSVLRNGQVEVLEVRPEFDGEGGRWLVGISTELVNERTESRSSAPWIAFRDSFVNTWELLVLVKQGITGAFSSGSAPQFSGPVGIAQITGEFTREGGLAGWLAITILLSINLAIINILPIPMLDGGRLVFVVLEWVRRGKRVPPEKEGLVHLIGFVALLGLIVLITANDIARLVQGHSFLGG
jgi:regulator of sigma E protease